MAPLQTNATLTAVAGSGTADDWDRPAVAGAAKWNGAARVYYREAVRRSAGAAGELDVATTYTLFVDTADFDLLDLDTDDVVSFTPDGETAKTAKATTLARIAAPATGLASVATSRIELERPVDAP